MSVITRNFDIKTDEMTIEEQQIFELYRNKVIAGEITPTSLITEIDLFVKMLDELGLGEMYRDGTKTSLELRSMMQCLFSRRKPAACESIEIPFDIGDLIQYNKPTEKLLKILHRPTIRFVGDGNVHCKIANNQLFICYDDHIGSRLICFLNDTEDVHTICPMTISFYRNKFISRG